MNWKQRRSGSDIPPAQPQGPSASSSASSSGTGEFPKNVFTWTGPGVENVFIGHEPARDRAGRSRL